MLAEGSLRQLPWSASFDLCRVLLRAAPVRRALLAVATVPPPLRLRGQQREACCLRDLQRSAARGVLPQILILWIPDDTGHFGLSSGLPAVVSWCPACLLLLRMAAGGLSWSQTLQMSAVAQQRSDDWHAVNNRPITVVGRLAHPTHPGGKRQRRILRHCLSVEDKSRNRMTWPVD